MWNPLRRSSAPDEVTLAVATFVIGAGVMAVEITASRLLAPYFGASMFVWTSLIVTVLAALSVGYWIGGKAASKGIGLEAVGLLLLGSAVLLVFGTLIIPSFSSSISGLLVALSSASIALFLGSLFVTMVVFAAPVLMLAVAGPILLKAWSALGDVGAVSGRYFAVSTVGSVLGTVAPTLLLVPSIGARHTILLVGAMFVVLGAALLPKKRLWLAAVVVFALAVPLLFPAKLPSDVLAQRESPYQLIRVSQDADMRFLIFNEGAGIQSVYAPARERTGFYYDYIGILPLVRPKPGTHRGLIVGLAGGTLARRYPSFMTDPSKLDLTGVEVDPAVIDVARKYFDLDQVPVKVVNEDGRTFLASSKGGYDSIVVDAYSTQLYIPPHLATKEFFALLRSKLAPGGVFMMNVNAPDDSSRLLVGLANTVASAFPHVAVVPVKDFWNHLIVASDQPLDLDAVSWRIPESYDDVRGALRRAYDVAYDPKAETFTDDRAPVEFLTDSMILAQAFQHAR